MDKLTILKLYRAIGFSYLKIQSYNSAIAIFAHYVESLILAKKDMPKRVNDINKELEATQKVMFGVLKKQEITKEDEDTPAKFRFFGKHNEENIQKKEEKLLGMFKEDLKLAKLRMNEVEIFKNYPQNLRFIQDSLNKGFYDEEMLNLCAKHLFFLEQYDIAEEILNFTIKKYPKNTYSKFLKCQVLITKKEFISAVKYLKDILKIETQNDYVYFCLGNIYRFLFFQKNNKQYLKQSINTLKKACELKEHFNYLLALADASADYGEIESAREIYQKLMKKNPSYDFIEKYTHFCIQTGDLENFKKNIDSRLYNVNYINRYCMPIYNKPMWDCEKDISDKTLLVVVEQGFGDIFMFCRTLKEAEKKAKKVIFLARKSIIKLFKYNFPNIEILDANEISIEDIQFDYFIYIMSLIKLWDFSKPQTAYLDVDPKDVRKFRAMYVDQRKFNIGTMYTSCSHDGFSKRNIPVEDIKLLTKNVETQLYSLSVDQSFAKKQKEYGIVNIGKYFNDFYDTAVAIKAMHLIVTTDNVVLNLAGALGEKTFGLFNANTLSIGKWWKKEGENVGWYDSVKPFVTEEEDNWPKLLTKLQKDIEDCRLSARENYLLSLIKKGENDKTISKEDKLAEKALLYETLWRHVYKTKYLRDFIKTQKSILKIKPNDPVCKANIASTMIALPEYNEKECSNLWNEVIDKIESPDLLFNFGCYQGRINNFDKLFEYYDYRFKKKKMPAIYPEIKKPQWKGERKVSDKTLLVHYEQGFGDTILFSRYIDEVCKIFKKVIFVVTPNLKTLIEENFPKAEVTTTIPNIEEFDYHIPLLSIFTVLKLYPKNYKKTKWIKANKQKVKEFRKYFKKDKYNIGVFWESNQNNLLRNSDLETFMPLAYLDNVQLYSLHINKEDIEVNYIDEKIKIENIGKHFKDFSDTAAAIQNCDLIISTDSAVLNLAGAMGKKTFGIFNTYVEWRWASIKNGKTIWYKSVKPYQAKKQNDMKSCIKEACEDIREIIKNDKRFKK